MPRLKITPCHRLNPAGDEDVSAETPGEALPVAPAAIMAFVSGYDRYDAY